MAQTHTYTTYSFNELTPDAQQNAIDNTRNDEYYMQDEWWDYTYDLAKEAGEILGLTVEDIWFSGFSSQGDGASMEASYSYAKGWKKALTATYGSSTLLEELITIGQAFQDTQKSALYQLEATTNQIGRYHSQSTSVYHCEYRYQELLDGAEDAICEAITDFTAWIYKRLNDEYDHINSDEMVKESITANDWQFTKDGIPA